MLGLGIAMIVSCLWISFEIWRAPVYDDEYRIVQPQKKIIDLFRKK